MSFAKYAQFYKDNGFFAGSKIKATVTDNTFIGQELVLSKGNEILRSATIPTSGKVDFFTDESGELTLSSDNGTSTISGVVEITNYATYNVTLDGTHTDNEREVYPDKNNVAFDLQTLSDTVTFMYTGDKAVATVASSDHNVATASIRDNVVTITKANNENDGNCTVAVTIPSTNKYKAKSFNISVSKTGRVGEWATASGDTLINMVQAADRGELNLRDYWNVGDTRVVTLQSISPITGSLIQAQPTQQIELVLMYDSISDIKYQLASEVPSHRTRPSFVVGLKNCLENLTPIDYEEISRTVTSKYSASVSETFKIYRQISPDSMTKLDTWLNVKFYDALPPYIKTILKNVNVIYANLILNTFSFYQETQSNIAGIYLYRGTKTQKITLPSSKEIRSDFIRSSTSGQAVSWGGNSVIKSNGYMRDSSQAGKYGTEASLASEIEEEGTQFPYYTYAGVSYSKKRGINGEKCQYYTRSSGDICGIYEVMGSTKNIREHRANAIIKDDGYVGKIDKADHASTYAGISPIMFI